jgi:hypothetical protein
LRKSRRFLASVRRRPFSSREDLAPPVWLGEGTKANHLIICNYDGVMMTVGSVITGDEPLPSAPRAASRTDRGTAPCVV